ncbi:hypothetical protein AB6A40_000258 [Gnathostoma spinigerum]|uniref:Uncharacterized protein n=1 Tax=Gnathostoma spinigerum TaxID=75299 RepID=A0ABD6E855_9BILA
MNRLIIIVIFSVVVGVYSSFPIYSFIISESKSGVLLEFYRFLNETLYESVHDSDKVTVVLFTYNDDDEQRFKEVEKHLGDKATFAFEYTRWPKLKTKQLHVIIHNANSPTLKGEIKFMVPLRRVRPIEIEQFINTSIDLEKQLISPNVDKVLCSPLQSVVLMNTVIGKFKSFTMYASTGEKSENITGISERNSFAELSPDLAKTVLNPIDCNLMFGSTLYNLASRKVR